MALSAHRGEILHFLRDPVEHGESAIQHLKDGVLVIDEGRVVQCGDAAKLLPHLPDDARLSHHTNGLIVPGFIDTHVHFPQVEVMGAYGTQLLDWLETHTFPAERKFADRQYADEVAQFFLDQLLKNGTTTALVFGTVHPQSVDAFFTAAEQKNLRMICGKVMMDRNAPEYLRDSPEQSYYESRELIERWHKKDRLRYAVTPRFAPTSSEEQLQKASDLLKAYPDVHFHTHLAENKEECEWVASLFPDDRSYLSVYDRFKLLGRRSVFAHSIYLDKQDWARIGQCGAGVAHCPMSNLFIGSGLFDLQAARSSNVHIGLGTDIGGGDSFSILRTINEAYKIQQLRGENLSPFESLYHATLGGAKTLDLEGAIGNFEEGREADFVVLDYAATPLIDFRIQHCQSLMERLFVMQMLGDDRAIRHTYILGERY
ncbi:MAG: guanine deaminase [Acidiferrobacterales bacterium]|nr:guanine deaminase [Acidiferrobacterales bacterium]